MEAIVLELIVSRLDRIENKVDDLVRFRWFLLGVTTVISVVITIGMKLIL